MHEMFRNEGRSVRIAAGLGSNLGDRRRHLTGAVRRLGELLADLRCSSVYEARPAEGVGGGAFLNLCCVGHTRLSPGTLLARLQRIERRAGRPDPGDRGRAGPRVLDLDLLLYGDRAVRLPDLEVPHPRLAERAFVLVPLAEVAGDWTVPGLGEPVSELARRLDPSGLRRVGSAADVAPDGCEGDRVAENEREEGPGDDA